ncbi:hypothetical protein DQG13_13730 [Paenibacillus sp. YN15]|nr:hypothetical protein DQG13_13730 [Paenibacillus sp. YN15]
MYKQSNFVSASFIGRNYNVYGGGSQEFGYLLKKSLNFYEKSECGVSLYIIKNLIYQISFWRNTDQCDILSHKKSITMINYL